jgi:Domain of unknown function (DUF4350)
MSRRIQIRREWLVLVAGLAIVGAITALTSSGATASEPPLSAANAQPNGALVAYRWLPAIGYRVERVSSSNLSAPSASDTTILLLQPQPALGGAETRRLVKWMRAGGIVVAAARPPLSRLLAVEGASSFTTPASRITIREPLLASPPASTLDARATWAVLPGRGVTVATSPYGSVLVRAAIGKGVLWIISAPQALDNAHLDHKGNRALLVSLIGMRGRAAAFTALPFLQGHHPNASLFSLPWGIAILFALLVALAYRWLGGWRLGPPIAEPEFNTQPATDYVIAVANLLRKARGRADVLRLYEERLDRLSESRTARGEMTDWNKSPQARPSGNVTDDELLARCREIVDLELEMSGSGRARW